MKILAIASTFVLAACVAPQADLTRPDAPLHPVPDTSADVGASALDGSSAGVDTRPSLILLLHGYTFTGPTEYAYEGMAALGSAAIVIDPTSTIGYWNGSTASCCFGSGGSGTLAGSSVAPADGSPNDGGPDDVALLSELVEQRLAVGDVNPSKIYAWGHSSGAIMVWRLLCTRSDLFRAGVVFEGFANSATDPACTPAAPMQVLDIHGTDDNTLRYAESAEARPGFEPYPANVGPGGSTDQEGTAAGCTSSLRPAAVPQITDAVVIGPQYQGTLPVTAVNAWTRGCGGRADYWQVMAGSHQPMLQPTFAPAVLTWLAATAP